MKTQNGDGRQPVEINVSQRERGSFLIGMFREFGRSAARGVIRVVVMLLVLVGCIAAAVAIVMAMVD